MADIVQQYHDVAMQLVNEAIEFAKVGVYNEQTAQNIRSVQIVSQVLQSALLQASAVPRPPPGQMPEPPVEATQARARAR